MHIEQLREDGEALVAAATPKSPTAAGLSTGGSDGPSSDAGGNATRRESPAGSNSSSPLGLATGAAAGSGQPAATTSGERGPGPGTSPRAGGATTPSHRRRGSRAGLGAASGSTGALAGAAPPPQQQPALQRESRGSTGHGEGGWGEHLLPEGSDWARGEQPDAGSAPPHPPPSPWGAMMELASPKGGAPVRRSGSEHGRRSSGAVGDGPAASAAALPPQAPGRSSGHASPNGAAAISAAANRPYLPGGSSDGPSALGRGSAGSPVAPGRASSEGPGSARFAARSASSGGGGAEGAEAMWAAAAGMLPTAGGAGASTPPLTSST